MKNIPYGRQFIDKEDIKLVTKSLKSKLITTGTYVKEFERKTTQFLKCKYAISCSSGTAALHLAFLSIDLKKNDIVVMPAVNFVAAYNICQLIGAKVFIADVDKFTGQMSPSKLIHCIKENNLKNIKAIITMYLGGYPENIEEFYKIKKKYKCYLIEDACHAFGAKYKSKNKILHVGSCSHSDIATFSFHPVKTMTTGEGGLITTNNINLKKKILLIRSHGILKKQQHWKYNVVSNGLNYRLSDINCALGLGQLKKINKFINYRKKLFYIYKSELKKISNMINFPIYSNNKPAYHLFLVSINFKKLKSSKDKLLKFLKSNNIFCQYHYIPIYKFKLFSKKIDMDFYKGANYYYKNTLSLPIFFNLKFSLQRKILLKIKIFFKKF
jgi:dTDP-4-amino-4,6-dideoxygalactose transaminase